MTVMRKMTLIAAIGSAIAAALLVGNASNGASATETFEQRAARELSQRANILVRLDASRLTTPMVVPAAATLTPYDRRAVLRGLVERVAPGETTSERVEAWVRYLQDHIAHPAYPPMHPGGAMVTDPLWIVSNGLGQCGQTNRVVVDGLQAIGVPARLVQLSEHVAAEAYYDGQWHFLDADWLNLGQFVRKPDGTIPSVVEIYADPGLLASVKAGREWEFYPADVTHEETYKPYRQMFTHVTHSGHTTPYYYVKTATPEQEHNPLFGWDHYVVVDR